MLEVWLDAVNSIWQVVHCENSPCCSPHTHDLIDLHLLILQLPHLVASCTPWLCSISGTTSDCSGPLPAMLQTTRTHSISFSETVSHNWLHIHI